MHGKGLDLPVMMTIRNTTPTLMTTQRFQDVDTRHRNTQTPSDPLAIGGQRIMMGGLLDGTNPMQTGPIKINVNVKVRKKPKTKNEDSEQDDTDDDISDD